MFGLHRVLSLAGSVALIVGLSTSVVPRAAAYDRPSQTAERGVLSKVAASRKANTFVTAVVAAGLVEPLTKSKPITVFVPTDEAFAKLPPEVLSSLLEPSGIDKLQAILKYHVVNGSFKKEDLSKEPRPRTLTLARLAIAANDHGIAVNNATVVEADFIAKNGVVHFIDTVLIPPAPDLIVTAEKAGMFKLLLAALKSADLESTFQGEGLFTILAPTDEAFQALGHDTLNNLLKPENRSKLQSILKYHVIPYKLGARDGVAAAEVKTLQGQPVIFSIKDGRLLINESKVVATDIQAANGIIHVIDQVLVPKPEH